MTKTHCLILVGHGSRRFSWSQQFEQIANRLRHEGQDVRTAYLEFNEPSLTHCLENTTKDGIKHITILPLFISNGKHTEKDIPLSVDNFKDEYNDTNIKVLPCLGELPEFYDFLINLSHTQSRE